jgi:hypothetical protein
MGETVPIKSYLESRFTIMSFKNYAIEMCLLLRIIENYHIICKESLNHINKNSQQRNICNLYK